MGNPAKLDELAIKTIRGLSMDAVQAANSGHPGTPMALAPLGRVARPRPIRLVVRPRVDVAVRVAPPERVCGLAG